MFINHLKILYNFRDNYRLLIKKIYEIQFRKKKIYKFKNEIKDIKGSIKTYYKNDCMRFKDKKIIKKMKQYNYIQKPIILNFMMTKYIKSKVEKQKLLR